MGQDGQQHGQVFAHGFGAAGQVDDQGLAAYAGDGAGEHGVPRDFEAFGTQCFADAGGFSFNDGFGRFGGDVAGGETRSAGGEDEGKTSIAPLAQGLGDGVALVGDDGLVGDGPMGETAVQNLLNNGAAAVFIFPGRAPVADGEDTNLHIILELSNL